MIPKPTLLLLAGLLLSSAPAAAQPAPKPKAGPAEQAQSAPPSSSPAAPALPRAAISRVVDALARELAPSGSRAIVVAAPLVSDAAAPRAAQLTATLATQLAGRLGSGAQARTEPVALAGARVVAGGAAALIHLGAEIAAGKLRVTADVYPVPRTVWARIRDPEPGPVAHAFAEAAIDAEVRSFLAPVSLISALSVERAKNFESDVVALGCGDLDADGAPEILSVSRRRISLVRLQGGKVIPIVSRPWTELAGVHPTPLREPIGFATLVARELGGEAVAGFADVGLTDRAKSLRVDGRLEVSAEMGGIAVPDGGGTACTRVWGLTVSGPLAACAPGDPAPVSASVGGQYDALASAQLLGPKGEAFAVWAGRERGVLELRDSAGRRQVVASAGAQVAVGDLDQDGEPEILASLDVQSAFEDAVVVWSWPRRAAAPGDRPREALRLPAPAGVHALAVCPPDGPGRVPFAVATTDEIWVVR
ncbi:MAG TPA: hypothetical protein VLS89_08070 [Candidatus Nanopelagicales bacterium]|nr:hypothetical protein [Candidatus Nanopelagicales bacterium]